MFKRFFVSVAVSAILPVTAFAATESASVVGDSSLSTTSIDGLDATFSFEKFDDQGGTRTLTGATFTFDFEYEAYLELTNITDVELRTQKGQDYKFGRPDTVVDPDAGVSQKFASGEGSLATPDGGTIDLFSFNNDGEMFMSGAETIAVGGTFVTGELGETGSVTFTVDDADLAEYIAASPSDTVAFDVLSSALLGYPQVLYQADGYPYTTEEWVQSAMVSASGSYSYVSDVAPIPLPGGLALLGLGVAGLGIMRRKRV